MQFYFYKKKEFFFGFFFLVNFFKLFSRSNRTDMIANKNEIFKSNWQIEKKNISFFLARD